MQKKTLKLFWSASKPYAGFRNTAIAAAAFASLCEGYLAPYVLSQIFDRIQRGNVTLANTWTDIALYACLLIAGSVVGWRVATWGIWKLDAYAMRDLSVQIMGALSSHSIGFHANRFGGSLVSQTTKLVGALERFWDMVIWQVTPFVVAIVSATIILSIVFWQYALVLAVLTIVFTISAYFGSKFLYERGIKDTEAWNILTGFIADVVTNISTVKAFGSNQLEVTRARDIANNWVQRNMYVLSGFLGVTTVWSILMTTLSVAAICFAVGATERGMLSVGAVYLMLTYSLNVGRNLWEFTRIARDYNGLMGDAYEMTKIMELPIDVIDVSRTKLVATRGHIEFRDVSFAHDDGDGTRVFENFNLTIPAGQRVGIVGMSGSGKTTLMRLLLRFSDIDAGSICIDGQDISQVSQQSLRQAIAYVAQEPMLFHRSLTENIAYGRPRATHAEVISAAKKANAWGFIKKLPEGLDTLVGERGVKLSGGQRQRIVLARAILKSTPVLVFDEATSALDSESEKLIQDSLEDVMDGHTSIVIAHRLSTIAKLDRIVVLENGEIVEDGSHAELIDHGGVYAKLWSHQSGGFIEA